MDPTTTLVTFMFQTEPSVQSVRLIGSWDNFTMCYSMERDARRGQGQWRGCFTFQNIVCDDENPTRNTRSGGLKMGQTYYYYYEVDGSTETFDATMPCTTMCPYMPGQTVNSLFVPVEHTLRTRSASANSVRAEDFRTMDPATKFMKPLPPTPLLPSTYDRRALSAPSTRPSSSSSRSSSPPTWKRLFSRKPQTYEGLHRPSASHGEASFASSSTRYDKAITVPARETRHGRTTSSLSEGARARDISPGSLSRILREGRPASRRPSHPAQPTPLIIPDDVIEEDEDDDNFAVSAISESLPYVTGLSPPPFQRSASSESIKHDAEARNLTASMARPLLSVQPPVVDRGQPLSAVANETNAVPHWSTSAKVTTSPIHEDVPMSFYDDGDDDDEDDDDGIFGNEDEANFPSISISKTRLHSFSGYSLPRHIEETKASHQSFAAPISPKLVPSGTNFLDTHIEAGLDDFVSELGWIVGTIGTTDSP